MTETVPKVQQLSRHGVPSRGDHPAALPGQHLEFALIGQGAILAVCAEHIRALGHTVVLNLDVGGMRNARHTARRIAKLIQDHRHDVLLSCGNPFILDAATIAAPRLAAVNYHNAPLPRYAGLRATAWAVFNGEREHGITWHSIADQIDSGRILLQRRFALRPEETAASLDIQCAQAAVESLEELVAKLQDPCFDGVAQDLAQRTYYRRQDTAPGNGVIDWRSSSAAIVRLVRACAGGVDSNFGIACALAPSGRRLMVLDARCGGTSGQPGIVSAVAGATITVGCSDGAVELVLARQVPLPVGAVLPNAAYSGATKTIPPGPTVLDLLAGAAALDGDAPAIVDAKAGDLSHRQLAARSGALARRLITAGCEQGDGIGIMLPPGREFVIAALAAMRAGAAYVPLDSSLPLLRRDMMIQEAGVSHIVTTASLAKSFGNPVVSVILIDGETVCSDIRLPAVTGDDCAYRMFTSGSTGRPKAVEITHASLRNLVDNCCSNIPLTPQDRMTMLASPTFDASVADIWPVLAAGGALLIPPTGILLDPGGLITWLAECQATCTFVPTAIIERLLRMAWPPETTLRVLLTGGEALHRRPPPGLPFRLINSYGPTENTVASLWSEVAPGDGTPTIGQPINGVTCTLLDEAGAPVGDGEYGEIVLGGAQVARGYRGRRCLTEQVFEADPVAHGKRRYRTGDRGRLLPDGDIEFGGRIDSQVQVMGIRVEPGEIEALLKTHAFVADAACVPNYAENTVTGLTAHVAMTDASEDASAAAGLRDWLEQRLPAAILPKRVVLHRHLPVTTTGKIDRQALGAHRHSDGSVCEPVDVLEALWWRTLGQLAEPRDQSFWQHGGDSLAAINMLAAVEELTGTSVPVGVFLSDPTLRGLQLAVASDAGDVVRLKDGRGPPLICWYGYTGDLEVYRHLLDNIGDRLVLGVIAPGSGDAPSSLEEAAAHGIRALRSIGVREPAHHVGYSWGGLLAFEAARQLTAAGSPPAFVGLIGTTPPHVERRLASTVGRFIRVLPRATSNILSGRQKLRLMSRGANVPNNEAEKLPPAELQTHRGRTNANLALARKYRPALAAVPNVRFFRETAGRHHVGLSGQIEHEKPDYGWCRWAGSDVPVYWVDGDHLSVMRGPGVAAIAAVVCAAMPS